MSDPNAPKARLYRVRMERVATMGALSCSDGPRRACRSSLNWVRRTTRMPKTACEHRTRVPRSRLKDEHAPSLRECGCHVNPALCKVLQVRDIERQRCSAPSCGWRSDAHRAAHGRLALHPPTAQAASACRSLGRVPFNAGTMGSRNREDHTHATFVHRVATSLDRELIEEFKCR